MDHWEKDKLRHGRQNPSFSSTLLDAIYRSIDEGDGEGEEALVLYRETMRKKQSNNSSVRGGNCVKQQDEEEMASIRRACMIEKWMEKKASEKVVVRRKSVPDFDRKLQNDRASVLLNSSSSSSDSSCGGGFSSSEAESVYGTRSRSSTITSHSQRPKPIRTSVSVRSERSERPSQFEVHQHERKNYNSVPQQKPKHENGFVKTKSRASKIYDDLKKVKQPISPGGRLASFLNSIFTAGNPKKAKISTSINGGGEDTSSEMKSKSEQASTCSSASSFSRSCLSKTPSSTNRIKRSVRFYPVSVIFDEDCRPCGHKCLYEDEPGLMAVTTVRKNAGESQLLNEDLKFLLTEKNRRVEEAARDLLKGYQKKSDYAIRDLHVHDDEDDDDDYDDAASDSSSDLFELNNLAAIGIERYREELPVYETTHLGTNRAIANGLIL